MLYYQYLEISIWIIKMKKDDKWRKSWYETYLNKEVSGRDLTTAVNRAVDNNEKNKVSKDEKGFYIGNDINSIIIEIKISDNVQHIKWKLCITEEWWLLFNIMEIFLSNVQK